MDNLKWKFELSVSGIDKEACDKILNLLRLIIGSYGGEMNGGFVPDEKAEIEEENIE